MTNEEMLARTQATLLAAAGLTEADDNELDTREMLAVLDCVRYALLGVQDNLGALFLAMANAQGTEDESEQRFDDNIEQMYEINYLRDELEIARADLVEAHDQISRPAA